MRIGESPDISLYKLNRMRHTKPVWRDSPTDSGLYELSYDGVAVLRITKYTVRDLDREDKGWRERFENDCEREMKKWS